MRIRFNLLLASATIGLLALATAAFAQNQAEYYVLDGFGGVHAGGGAPSVGGTTPYFGFNIARGIAYAPGTAGTGVLVLDGFGGVHKGGGLGPVTPATAYFGFDIAKAIVYRSIPPRAAGDSDSVVTDLDTASAAYTIIESVTIFAPDDGFLLVVGSAYVGCNSISEGNNLGGELTINIDATTEPPAIADMGIATFPNCNYAASGTLFQTNNQTLAHLFPVSAGSHTVNFLARKVGGSATASLRVLGRSLTALFIDHNSTGGS
jgi:hypothetical protein